MRNTWTICQRELRSYFTSPIAYHLLAMYGVIFGYFFWNILGYFVGMGLRAQMQGQSMPMNINEQMIRPLLANTSVIGLFLIPIITMRLFAEEKKSGTIELLLTSPVRDWEIVFGKWSAGLLLYISILAVSAVDLLFLFAYGNPDWRPVLVAYLGLTLQAGALIAIGTFISTTTSDQITAAAITFDVSLLLWVLDWSAGYESATWAQVLSYFSVNKHLESFSKGVIDSKDAIFFVSMIVLGLFLSARSLESLRWRT